MGEIQSSISESNRTSLDTKKASFVEVSNVSMTMQNYREMYKFNLSQEQEEKENIDLILLTLNNPIQVQRNNLNIQETQKKKVKEINPNYEE